MPERRSFPSVRGGFHAVIGNPPWVLYVGKGSQPIDAREKEYLEVQFGRGAKPLSTHGLFATLGGRLCRPGARVGLILPTSVADASRYSDVRAAHNQLCQPESDLPEFGEDAFNEVFQPCMALLSTYRAEACADNSGDPWPLAQTGMEPWIRELLAQFDALPKLPGSLFTDCGYRSSKADAGKFAKLATPAPPLDVPLFEGTSVREFELLPPTAFGDGEQLPNILPADKWRRVDVFIRNTARYPIASPSSRVAFRNSVIAARAQAPHTAGVLLAYLNSTPVRWYHYHKQRDAQQGMPQVKVGHLRALPAPDEALLAELDALGSRLSARCQGISPDERAELDALVGRALAVPAHALERVLAWGAANPPPEARQAPRVGPGVRKATPEAEATGARRAAGGSDG